MAQDGLSLEEYYLGSVAYLCVDSVNDEGHPEPTPAATAFLIWLEEPKGQRPLWKYIVTARHNLDSIAGEKVAIRFNSRVGAIEQMETEKSDWHQSIECDVALHRFQTPKEVPDNIEYVSIPASHAVAADGKPGNNTGRVGVGDIAIILGLFSGHPGQKRNLPIARFGRVSALPAEVITFETILPTEPPASHFIHAVGYLVECLSWGGVSGSPVLWAPQTGGTFGLLGLVSGHFPIGAGGSASGSQGETLRLNLNSGIAVVTPAACITDLLMSDSVQAERDHIRAQTK